MLLIGIIQMVVVLGAILAFWMFTEKEVQPQKVYVYTSSLETNQEITANDVKQIEIPSKAVQKGFALKSKDIVGKYAGAPVKSGQYVYKSQAIELEQKDVFEDLDLSTYRKISLPISYVEGFGGSLKRGDAVDLVFTGEGNKKDEETGYDAKFQYSKTFLQNVYVYGITTSDGFPFVDHSTSYAASEGGEDVVLETTANTEELKVVTLAVTLEQAEELLARQSAGSIRLVARFQENESYETLGFVLGDYDKVFTAPANAETGRGTINE